MLRLTREGKPNLFIYKHQIRTITEAGRRRDAAVEPRMAWRKRRPDRGAAS